MVGGTAQLDSDAIRSDNNERQHDGRTHKGKGSQVKKGDGKDKGHIVGERERKA